MISFFRFLGRVYRSQLTFLKKLLLAFLIYFLTSLPVPFFSNKKDEFWFTLKGYIAVLCLFLFLSLIFFFVYFIFSIRLYKRIKFLVISSLGDFRDLNDLPLLLIKMIKNDYKLRLRFLSVLVPELIFFIFKDGQSIYFYQEKPTNLNFKTLNDFNSNRELLVKTLTQENKKKRREVPYFSPIIRGKWRFKLISSFCLEGSFIFLLATTIRLFFIPNTYSYHSIFYSFSVIFFVLFLASSFFWVPNFTYNLFRKSLSSYICALHKNNPNKISKSTKEEDLLLFPINKHLDGIFFGERRNTLINTNITESLVFSLLGTRIYLPDSLTSNIVLKMDSNGLTFFKIKDDKLEEIV